MDRRKSDSEDLIAYDLEDKSSDRRERIDGTLPTPEDIVLVEGAKDYMENVEVRLSTAQKETTGNFAIGSPVTSSKQD